MKKTLLVLILILIPLNAEAYGTWETYAKPVMGLYRKHLYMGNLMGVLITKFGILQMD